MTEIGFEEYPVQYLKMVGPHRFTLLKKLGIRTIKDLLYHFPRAYQQRTVKPLNTCTHGEQVTLRGKVVEIRELNPRSRLWITRVKVQEPGGFFFAVW
ncbi:MAG: DNA helicase RecG, partial [Desulfofundulus sp.]